MDKKTENEILQFVSYSDYQKGRNYFRPYVEYMEKEQEGNELIHNFRVESERTLTKYKVIIKIDLEERGIKSTYCSCPQFRDYDSCKHVAACLYNYYDELIPKYITKEDKLKFTKELYDIFSNIDKNKKNTNKKEEVKLDVYLSGGNNNGYSVDSLALELKIGTAKQYSCKERKLSQFLEAYSEQRDYYFGKNFNYDPNTCYFNEENKKILDFLVFLNEHKDSYYSTYQLIKGSKTIKDFLELLKNKRITLNNYMVLGHEKGFPISSKLKKEGEDYHLFFELNTELYLLTKDLEWIQKKNRLFKLGQKEKALLVKLVNEDMNEIIIDEQNKNNFSKYILPSIHQNIEMEEGIEEFKVSKTISPKLYFDILRDKLSCAVKFLYDEEEINYFDEGTTIVRNNDFELEVIQDLLSYSFVEENKNFLLKEMDEVGEFLENKINELSEKYEVYTSEKLKELKVIKKPTVKSTFSIGKDNIMSYSFQMNDVDDEELSLLMSAYKNKKKYYRLKSGDLVNLENSTDLDELNNLMEDMNISSKDLDKGNLSLPKYRAIYLDSLKRSKYHIIETNNLFDELIEKFEKYKDAEISLSKKEENLLRDYQKDGVKWLCNIDKTGFGGILADEMGLGKSIQTIYYMKELLKEDKSYQFLIVVPTSLAYNWENEFDKFEPSMKKIIMVGNRKIRREKFEQIKDYNIVVTTYGLLREDQEYYKELHFKTVIIDEAQNIKNTHTEITKSVKNIKGDTFLALTGTPIENSIDELWSIFDFIMPGFLPEMTQFDRKFRVKDFDEESSKKLAELNRIISPFILRRRKRDVVKDLPPKIENNIYIDLGENQKKLYLLELERVNKETERILQEGGMKKLRFLILQLLTRLRQICIDPRLVYEDYKKESSKMEEFSKVVENMVSNNHKILVFTSFREALKLAKKELDKKKITSYTIDGSTSSKKRMELVESFNQDDTNVFFIMLKAGGTGLNLASADVVIHLDLWWNPQAENQATDRSHRIGQKNTVEVIKLIAKGTIEEKILELQEKKKILSDKLIEENTSDLAFSKLSEEDIKNLLSFEE